MTRPNMQQSTNSDISDFSNPDDSKKAIMGEEAEDNAERPQIFVSNPAPAPNSNPNSITASQFLAWRRRKELYFKELGLLAMKTPNSTRHHNFSARKDADASARKAEAARKRAEDIAVGLVQMNGRELFVQEPWVFDNSRY